MISLRFLLLIFLVSQPFRLDLQSQTPAAPDRKTSQPYSGDLSIFESPGRDKLLQIDRVMDILGIGPGKAVADIGAGSGWFSVRAARKVTSTGNVFAVDINPEAIRYIKNRATQEKLTNIQTVQSEPDNPQLSPDSIDAVLMRRSPPAANAVSNGEESPSPVPVRAAVTLTEINKTTNENNVRFIHTSGTVTVDTRR